MAWTVSGSNLQMCEGDYGLQLPITINGAEFAENDTIKIVFKAEKNGAAILEKEYTPTEGTINLMLSESESGMFAVGSYVYSLDWFHDGAFLCNIIPVAEFGVVDKA